MMPLKIQRHFLHKRFILINFVIKADAGNYLRRIFSNE